MKISTSIIALVLLLAQACGTGTQQRYFDYSGKDGCTPPNIGHRLGGDISSFSDNSIEGLHGIASRQDSACFKNWELDLSEWNGNVFLSHDAIESDDEAASLVSFAEFENAFQTITAIKPIIIDLKYISSDTAFSQIISLSHEIRSHHEPDVWFVVSTENVEVLNKICSFVAGGFDVMLYRRGGYHCARKNDN